MHLRRSNIPNLLERTSPEVQPLLHRTIPEEAQVRFIPDIDNKALNHIRLLHIIKRPFKKCIPTCPIVVISRVRKAFRLSTISTPSRREQVNELAAVFSGSPVVAQRRSKASLIMLIHIRRMLGGNSPRSLRD